jgi:radical SAM protein with 4Fe4S-binding SPASM domain
MIIQDNVFHVVLTGGEAFLNFQILEYAIEHLHEAGISTSVNTNLMLATPEKIERLKRVGLDHILTSLNSHDQQTTDYIANKKGAFDKITKGIQVTIEAGIRVSVNMIISELNKDHVYNTAKLCSELGAQRIFATRLVPSVTVENPEKTDFHISRESTIKAIDDLLAAKRDLGIGIGTLLSYPLCLLGDLVKYQDLVGRGCPAQRGNSMIINADGSTHACTHEMKSYGNVFETGIAEAFKRMRAWHDGSFLASECKECKYINICGSGCRSAALSYFKRRNAVDPLYQGTSHIHTHYKVHIPPDIALLIDTNQEFIVPDTIRFRQEDGFMTINVRWANTFTVDQTTGEYLQKKQASNGTITIKSMVGDNQYQNLIHLLFKEAIVPKNTCLREKIQAGIKKGCSISPEDLSNNIEIEVLV